VTLPIRPKRGGFLRSFGCGGFIREFLLGHGPNGSVIINPDIGSFQADIFREYKLALMKTTAVDRAIRTEEKRSRREDQSIDPEKILQLADEYLVKMPYKAQGCRYHSFVTYFSNLVRLGWVEPTGEEEPSAFQTNFRQGQPRRYYRLTEKGIGAGELAWANPLRALYGYRN
jgi:hypothetical protein